MSDRDDLDVLPRGAVDEQEREPVEEEATRAERVLWAAARSGCDLLDGAIEFSEECGRRSAAALRVPGVRRSGLCYGLG